MNAPRLSKPEAVLARSPGRTEPWLTIVTISFNQAEYLRQAIESVLSQKSECVEYIVVDPGSTDGSREIISEYSGSIDHVLFEADSGPADGLNGGFSLGSGDVGFFLNSDDFLLPNAVQYIQEDWNRSSSLDVVLAGAWLVDVNGKPLSRMLPTYTSHKTIQEGSSMLVQQGMSFRMNKFREVGGFNIHNQTCWDGELLYDFINSEAEIGYSGRLLAAFRRYEQALSAGGATGEFGEKWSHDIERMLEKMKYQSRSRRILRRLGLGRFIKHFRNPGVAAGKSVDFLLPSAMKRKWEQEYKQFIDSTARRG
jgi:glycosyltransferase involved in cell wall biosynthesis